MHIKIVETVKIFNINNKLLIEYPKNTLLDKIVDVWPIIAKYNNPNLFMIGKHADKYDGFRLITNEECRTNLFVSLFCANYIEKNGIAVLFDNDDLSDGPRYISNQKSLLLIDIEAIHIQRCIFKKNDIIECRTNYYSGANLIRKISDIYTRETYVKWSGCNNGMGLFVPNDFPFID